ncbi:hypothetical protein PHLGIDRAFT_121594 [Phlebiopsis gigantea 11061_1 CR5-6]|uniref:Uncharacterized protein n=1 Tax=Phlebiopsis gigantea (strain 11061_1 CR5-6) TaxID=745531 RepID=A0A0C3RSN5_PHLG1|nr:hypothetical protein PHLGIDRAFT_121594 [Phlebiopsis gigantea 11061_1 CR5-6]
MYRVSLRILTEGLTAAGYWLTLSLRLPHRRCHQVANMRVDLITSIAIYWYTTVLVPLFYVTNNLDVNILADAALRGIAAQLPRLEVTKLVITSA